MLLTSVARRLKDMNRMGIDVQAISTFPMQYYYRIEPDLGRQSSSKRPPSYYMKKIYFDTMVFDETQLEHLVNLWGADHVVIRTDYPYDMGYYKPVNFVEGAKLTRAQKDQIIGGYAAKLLGLKKKA